MRGSGALLIGLLALVAGGFALAMQFEQPALAATFTTFHQGANAGILGAVALVNSTYIGFDQGASSFTAKLLDWACAAHKWESSVTGNAPTCTQPAFSDISGTANFQTQLSNFPSACPDGAVAFSVGVSLGCTFAQNLIGYWPLNEGTGTTTYDYSGAGNSGALTNTPTWVQGKFGTAVSLASASSQYVNFGSYPNPSAGFTVSFWFKSSTITTFRHPICHGGENGLAGWCIYYNSNTGAWQTTVSNGVTTSTTNGCGANGDGNWHFFVLEFTPSSNAAHYIDNNICQSVSTTVANTSNNNEFVIGRGLNGQYWDGQIDDARMYSGVLSVSLMSWLYSHVPGE